MREIKFRGKRIDNGEWVYGSLIKALKGDGCKITEGYFTVGEYGEQQFAFDVDPATVGQYTGLRDKNGVEIFEGDILRYPPKDKWEEKSFVGYEIFYHDNDCARNHIGFQMNRMHFYGNICGSECEAWLLPKYTSRMVVISNIHQPELIESEGE